jgi:hypothetical protein
MQTTKEVLTKAREFLDDPSCWIRRAMGQRADGSFIYEGNVDDAVCCCSLGALKKFAEDETAFSAATETLANSISYLYILPPGVKENWPAGAQVLKFNDISGRKHSEILQVFDTAIALAAEDWKAYND